MEEPPMGWKWLGIVASLLLACLPCTAVEIGAGGALSCELITDFVAAGRGGDRDKEKILGSAINWATGYVTAAIEAARSEGKDFTDVDEPMIVKWIKNDCERHPEMQVQNVTRRFVTSLYIRDLNTRR
jgi:hypothetical protein